MSTPEPAPVPQPEAVSAAVTASAKFLTDEPRYSSAALSIALKIVGDDDKTVASLRPEYTHQCVGKIECFPGYHPSSGVLTEALEEVKKGDSPSEEKDEKMLLHKSHTFHKAADKELNIQVSLAPSCQSCQVDVNIQPSCLGKTDEPAAKRVRIQEDPSTAEDSDSSVWSEAMILDSLYKALPPIVERSNETDRFLTEPVGRVLEEYTIERDGSSNTPLNFVISLADGQAPNVAEHHSRVQPLALFYIENADNVDVTNTDNGYWKVMYVFEKHTSGDNVAYTRYSLVGYFTLFHFIALFHKPKPGVIVRICQALVLPPYQGQGHGGRMMNAVYKLAHDEYKTTVTTDSNTRSVPQEIVQVNVEDPAPAFVALRNKVDYSQATKHCNEWAWPGFARSDEAATTEMDAAFFTGLTNAQAEELGAKAKITPHQVHIINDLIKLKALDSALGDSTAQEIHNKEELERLFRLVVKKRLNKEHREELGGLASKDEQKAYLAELFDKQLECYNRILKRSS